MMICFKVINTPQKLKENNPAETKTPVITKVLEEEYPSPPEIACFNRDNEILKRLDLDSVVKTYGLEKRNEKPVVIMEDFKADSLKKLIKKGSIDLKLFLQIAIKLSETLGTLHKNDLVHKDIKPENILVNLVSKQVKITNLGMAALFPHRNEKNYNQEVIENLFYISPEQTGRMNRTVDYRTDLYSLGITFYEMLTGAVPFKSQDPLEIMHAHIAKNPGFPKKTQNPIPKVIIDIIIKLLSKTAEERYQNSFGLRADLERCLERLNKKGEIEDFEIAQEDISIKFNIPPILYGREDELDVLMTSYERACNGACEITLVSGDSGIGKSALIDEIHKPIIAKKGYFISGKYDQSRRDVPFSSIIQAFQGLVRQILAESEEKIKNWKEKLQEVLGPNGKVITNIIPEVELIIGKQADIPILGPKETQNRFNHVFKNFVNVFLKKEHPLVLFLDDLQWADLASLDFLRTLIADSDTKFLFLIGAYRDDEVTLLSTTLEEIKETGIQVNSISLSPLNETSVNQLIANFLRCAEDESLAFANLIHEKTGGNPFFVNQFLKTLYDGKTLWIDAQSGWTWNLEKIKRMQVTDNVVDLLAEKIDTLPQDTQEILTICACIGNRFDLETILTVYPNKDVAIFFSAFNNAINEGFISQRLDLENMYMFHHDRIQEAAYSLIPDEEKKKLHLKIGRFVLKNTEKDLYDKIFYVVDQLNYGIDLLATQEEKLELAELNLTAGKKAKKTAGYNSAVKYLKRGRELLPKNAWQDHYELALSLHREAIECEYFNINFDEAEKIFSIIIGNTKTNIDKANVYNVMIMMYHNKGQNNTALQLGLNALKMFSIKLPRKPTKINILIELIKIKLLSKKLKNFIALPEMTDIEKLAMVNILITTAYTAYFEDTALFTVMLLKSIRLYLKYGNHPDFAAASYMIYASIVGAGLGNFEESYKIGKMALRLNEKFNTGRFKCRAPLYFGYLIQHWKNHARNVKEILRGAYKLALETGDYMDAGHVINISTTYATVYGERLDDIFEEHEKYKKFFQENVKDYMMTNIYAVFTQMYLNLTGRTDDKCSLSSGGYNEEERLNEVRKGNNPTDLFIHLFIKMKILYLFGKYSDCYSIAIEMKLLLESISGVLTGSAYFFYYSLTLAALYSAATPREKKKYWKELKKNQKQIKKWADNCPENFLHQYLLISAEMARISDDDTRAVDLYHQAIASARENEYIQNEAIANELLAKFYLAKSYEQEAKGRMTEAHKGYNKWGATAKVKDLEEKYPELLSEITAKKDISVDIDKGLETESSKTLRSELSLDKLIKKIMSITIIGAGAQKGLLVIKSDKDSMLYIVAEGLIDKDNKVGIKLLKEDIKKSENLSTKIVNFVMNSDEFVVFSNAYQEQDHMKDSYIVKKKIKSVLCVPLTYRGKVEGVIYLENNDAAGAFVEERVGTIKALSTDMALSIRNAKLFEQATTDERTELISQGYFQNLLKKEIERAKRRKVPLSLLFIDFDNFKDFNDTNGHLAGNEVLRSVAAAMKDLCRISDIAARYGGEEFVIALPDTDLNGAQVFAEKLRTNIEKRTIYYKDNKYKVTISIGVAAFPTNAKDENELIEYADEAMYISKENGKNQVTVFQDGLT